MADQARAHQRVFDARTGIEIPAIARASRTASWFMVRKVRPRAGIIGLLGLPGDDPALDIDLPGTGAGAVHAMRRAHDLVCRPAFSVGVFPGPTFIGGDAIPVGVFLLHSPK